MRGPRIRSRRGGGAPAPWTAREGAREPQPRRQEQGAPQCGAGRCLRWIRERLRRNRKKRARIRQPCSSRAQGGQPPGGEAHVELQRDHTKVLYYLMVCVQHNGWREPEPSGRLYFCTSVGGFAEHVVPLDREARNSADEIAEAIGDALAQPFLPASPDSKQCDLCDFRVVCGPYEERRAARKSQGKLAPLLALRALP